MIYRRYVAIGDSTTEGLEDPDGRGGYRGWADRLAQHVADGQEQPLEYANLAVRGLRMHEIRSSQLAPALELAPDLLSVFGGVNDVIGVRCDFGLIAADYDAAFCAASELGATVLTFTMPDPAAINPLGRHLRQRMFALNAIVRAAASAYGVLVVDFERYPVACDPRLWYEDRLHGNALGHEVMATAMAHRLGLAGFDDSWTAPLPEALPMPRPREQLATDLDWAVHHLAPWVGRNLRRLPHGYGVSAKRRCPRSCPGRAPRWPKPASQDVEAKRPWPR